MENQSMKKDFYHQIIQPFILLSATAGSFIDLGLSAEQLLCLFDECLEVARHYHDDQFCINLLYIIAQKTRDLGKDAESLEYAKEMLGYAEELRLLDVQLLACMLIGDMHDPESACIHLKRAIELAKHLGQKQKEMASNDRLQKLYFVKGDHKNAIPCIMRCIDIAQEINKTDKLAHWYLMLTDAYIPDDYNQASLHGKKCIEIAKENNDNDVLMKAYVLMAKVCSHMEHFNEVFKYVKKYFAIVEKIPVHQDGASDRNSVYVLADQLDITAEQYDESVIDGKKCYKITVKVDFDLCFIFWTLGRTYLEQGNNEYALFCYKQVPRLVRQCNNSESLENNRRPRSVDMTRSFKGLECDALFKAGSIYVQWCHYNTAKDYYRKGHEIAKELKDSDVERFSTFLMNLLHHEVGAPNLVEFKDEVLITKQNIEKEDEAYQLFQTASHHESRKEYELALSCYQQCQSCLERQRDIMDLGAFIRLKIADINRFLKRYDTALQLCQEVLEESQKRGDKKNEANSHFMIGCIYYLQGNLTCAETYARQSIECFEEVFALLGKYEEFEIAIVDTYLKLYEFLTFILLFTEQNIEALETVDRYRARALNSQLTKYRMDKHIQEKPIQFDEIQSLVCSNKYTIIQYLSSKHGFLEEFCTFVVPCENKENFVRLQKNTTFFLFENLIENAFSEMNVRQINCEDRSLDDDSKNDDSEDTGNKEDIGNAVDKSLCSSLHCRAPVTNKQPSQNADERNLNSALKTLYSKLVQNVISDIKTDEIVFIPDGPLFKVPFAALRDPETGLYLSETKRIRIAPSISTLKILNDRPVDVESKNDVLIVGDPSVGKVMYNGKEKEIPSLVSATNEALAILKVFKQREVSNSKEFHVSSLLQEEATKAAVLEKLHQGASVVHIAAHGDIEKSCIALAPSPTEERASIIPQEEDYMLTMADVQKAKVRSKLVVLSCCHSGRGEIKAEGVVGMCRAFLASGARAVVGSLWPIDDNASRLFMVEFYKNLKEGESASKSLQLTMKYMREDIKFEKTKRRKTKQVLYKEPRYWAPFILIGDDVTVF